MAVDGEDGVEFGEGVSEGGAQRGVADQHVVEQLQNARQLGNALGALVCKLEKEGICVWGETLGCAWNTQMQMHKVK